MMESWYINPYDHWELYLLNFFEIWNFSCNGQKIQIKNLMFEALSAQLFGIRNFYFPFLPMLNIQPTGWGKLSATITSKYNIKALECERVGRQNNFLPISLKIDRGNITWKFIAQIHNFLSSSSFLLFFFGEKDIY